MINYKLKMEAVPFGQYYNTPAAKKYNLLANSIYNLSFTIYN